MLCVIGNGEVDTTMTMLEKGGFAAFCGILIVFLFWLVKRLLEVLQDNTRVIAANTATIAKVGETAAESLELHQKNHDLLLARPCIKED
jgi:cell division protein FtsB